MSVLFLYVTIYTFSSTFSFFAIIICCPLLFIIILFPFFLTSSAQLYVLVGRYNLLEAESSSQRIPVGKVFIHPDFHASQSHLKADIALVKLKKKIDMNGTLYFILFICLSFYLSIYSSIYMFIPHALRTYTHTLFNT